MRMLNSKETELLIKTLVDDLYWEYDRMSSSGQETLDRIAVLCGVPTNQQYNFDKDKKLKKSLEVIKGDSK